MTTQTARGLAAGQTDEERIERYLSLNPDFFERHQPLLARMRLPHMRTGSTVSLVERQVEVLREQKTDADRRLAEFIAVARANDSSPTASIASRAGCCARRTRSPRSTSLEASLREDFDAFHSVLLLTAPIESLRNGELRAVPARRRGRRREHPHLRSAARHRQAALRPGARHAARLPLRTREREHRLGGAGAAGRKRLARPAGPRQRRTRTLPSGHEHGVPEAHGRTDHGRALAARRSEWGRLESVPSIARPDRSKPDRRLPQASRHRAAPLAAHLV